MSISQSGISVCILCKKVKALSGDHAEYVHAQQQDGQQRNLHVPKHLPFGRAKQRLVKDHPQKGNTYKKDGVIGKRCSKVQAQSRQVRACHAAEWAADAKDGIGGTRAAKQPRTQRNDAVI